MTQPQEQALCPEEVLRELERHVPSGHYTTGSGSISSDGKFSGKQSVPIMIPANPDGHRAATLIRQIQAAIAEADRLANAFCSQPWLRKAFEPLAPFLPKPDKLVEAMREALPASMPDHHVAAIVRNLNDYCAKHGGTITWKDGE